MTNSFLHRLQSLTLHGDEGTKETVVARQILGSEANLRRYKASLESVDVPIPILMMNIGPKLRARLLKYPRLV